MDKLKLIKSDIEFQTALQRIETEKVDGGQSVYEWEYFDEVKNEFVKDTTNLYENIQSFADSVDLKKRIKRGEELNDGQGIYMDTTKFGDNFADIDKHLNNVVSEVRKFYQEIESKRTAQKDSKSDTVVRENDRQSGPGQNGVLLGQMRVEKELEGGE